MGERSDHGYKIDALSHFFAIPFIVFCYDCFLKFLHGLAMFSKYLTIPASIHHWICDSYWQGNSTSAVSAIQLLRSRSIYCDFPSSAFYSAAFDSVVFVMKVHTLLIAIGIALLDSGSNAFFSRVILNTRRGKVIIGLSSTNSWSPHIVLGDEKIKAFEQIKQEEESKRLAAIAKVQLEEKIAEDNRLALIAKKEAEDREVARLAAVAKKEAEDREVARLAAVAKKEADISASIAAADAVKAASKASVVESTTGMQDKASTDSATADGAKAPKKKVTKAPAKASPLVAKIEKARAAAKNGDALAEAAAAAPKKTPKAKTTTETSAGSEEVKKSSSKDESAPTATAALVVKKVRKSVKIADAGAGEGITAIKLKPKRVAVKKEVVKKVVVKKEAVKKVVVSKAL